MKQFSKSTTYKTVLLLFILFQTPVLIAQVGINQPNPDSSAVLDLKSNNKGVLIPRLTSAQIQSIENPDPSEGLLVYCTDLAIFCYYNGTYWMALPAWGWRLDLGDPSGFGQKISAHILNSDTKVGIGTNTPASKFTVTGNASIGDNAAAPANGAYIKGKVKIGNPPDEWDTQQLEVDGNINAEGNITATGNMNTTGKVQENGNDLLPKGAIIMWSGTSPPDGWALCDGTNGPDLRGRFIVGYENRSTIPAHSDNNYKTIESTGGEKNHTLTIDEMPSRNHNGATGGAKAILSLQVEGMGSGTDHGHELDQADNNPTSGYTNDSDIISQSSHTHTIASQGGGSAHENRPPYYVLAFIIKL